MANHAFYGNISSPVPELNILTGTYRFQIYDATYTDRVRYQSRLYGSDGETILNGFSQDPADAPDLGDNFDSYTAHDFSGSDPSTYTRGYIVFKDKWEQSQMVGLDIKYWAHCDDTPCVDEIQSNYTPMITTWSNDSKTGLPYLTYMIVHTSTGNGISRFEMTSGEKMDKGTLSVTAYMRNSAEVY